MFGPMKKPADHSLFINCGGQKLEFEGNQYEADTSKAGASYFLASREKWAYSITGYFTDKESAAYIANSPLSLNVTDSDLYQTARISPISLKYYGLCMIPGSYKVRLHFAEIQFSGGETFSSLGRRYFDVSIQVSKS